jgi:hypothetical protein
MAAVTGQGPLPAGNAIGLDETVFKSAIDRLMMYGLPLDVANDPFLQQGAFKGPWQQQHMPGYNLPTPSLELVMAQFFSLSERGITRAMPITLADAPTAKVRISSFPDFMANPRPDLGVTQLVTNTVTEKQVALQEVGMSARIQNSFESSPGNVGSYMQALAQVINAIYNAASYRSTRELLTGHVVDVYEMEQIQQARHNRGISIQRMLRNSFSNKGVMHRRRDPAVDLINRARTLVPSLLGKKNQYDLLVVRHGTKSMLAHRPYATDKTQQKMLDAGRPDQADGGVEMVETEEIIESHGESQDPLSSMFRYGTFTVTQPRANDAEAPAGVQIPDWNVSSLHEFSFEELVDHALLLPPPLEDDAFAEAKDVEEREQGPFDGDEEEKAVDLPRRAAGRRAADDADAIERQPFATSRDELKTAVDNGTAKLMIIRPNIHARTFHAVATFAGGAAGRTILFTSDFQVAYHPERKYSLLSGNMMIGAILYDRTLAAVLPDVGFQPQSVVRGGGTTLFNAKKAGAEIDLVRTLYGDNDDVDGFVIPMKASEPVPDFIDITGMFPDTNDPDHSENKKIPQFLKYAFRHQLFGFSGLHPAPNMDAALQNDVRARREYTHHNTICARDFSMHRMPSTRTNGKLGHVYGTSLDGIAHMATGFVEHRECRMVADVTDAHMYELYPNPEKL